MCPCPERPKCQSRGCDQPANRTLFRPWWPVASERVRWVCFVCLESYDLHINRHIPGLDRPPGADDNWRPSLIGAIHFAFMLERDEERRKQPAAPPTETSYDGALARYWQNRDERYTPQQRAQAEFARRVMRGS